MRWLKVLYACVAIAATVGVESAASAAPAALTATRHVEVRPVTAAGKLAPDYKITATLGGGDCWGTSIPVKGAYRCLSANGIYDPCWPLAGAEKSVVCLAAPWSKAVTRVRLTKPLAKLYNEKPSVWGLRLADGNGCGLIQGTSGIMGHVILDYGCSHDIWAGALNEKHKVWTVTLGRMESDGTFKPAGTARVASDWNGRPAVYR